MRILGFDTSTRVTTVALSAGQDVLERRDDPGRGGRPGHVSRLMPLIAEVMDRARVGFADVDRIAVGVGPGTFTGLRIGIATARALGQAAACPLVGVSTLRALAVCAARSPQGAEAEGVAAVLDARRGEVYAAAWDRHDEPLIVPRAMPPDELGEALNQTGLRLLAVGEGAVEFSEVLERSGALIPSDESELHRVTATAHLWIAEQLPPVSPWQIHPEYLRRPDVREPDPAAGLR